MEHPITPPPELVEQWYDSIPSASISWKQELANQAARWGDEQRLKAVCEWLAQETPEPYIAALRAAMRPKPPSLAEQAFDAAKEMSDCMSHGFVPKRSSLDIIRRALERLQQYEQQESHD